MLLTVGRCCAAAQTYMKTKITIIATFNLDPKTGVITRTEYKFPGGKKLILGPIKAPRQRNKQPSKKSPKVELSLGGPDFSG